MNDTQLVKYQAKDGIDISLDFETVKNYLVSGKKELVTPQEVAFFLGVCKSKGLNPFKKDVYLVKYTQHEAAAIVTSIDYFRSRARAQGDCVGWSKGIIVKRGEEIVYSNGLMLEGDELLGGWFKAQPKGWEQPFELEVNLKGFIKRKSDGTITRFWKDDNQPMMIAKVAESQGLRTIWPDEFQSIYEADEIPREDEVITVDPITPEAIPPKQAEAKDFDQLVADAAAEKKFPPGSDVKRITEYVKAVAAKSKIGQDKVKLQMARRFGEFLTGFGVWCNKQKEQEKKEKAKKDAQKKALSKKEEKKEEKAAPADPPPDPTTATMTMVNCPDTGNQRPAEDCKACIMAEGCPALEGQ